MTWVCRVCDGGAFSPPCPFPLPWRVPCPKKLRRRYEGHYSCIPYSAGERERKKGPGLVAPPAANALNGEKKIGPLDIRVVCAFVPDPCRGVCMCAFCFQIVPLQPAPEALRRLSQGGQGCFFGH